MGVSSKRLPAQLKLAVQSVLARELDPRPRAPRVELTAPWPPSTNNLYATVRLPTGRFKRVKSKEAKEYTRRVGNLVQHWKLRHDRRAPAPPYRLILRLYPPADKRRHDLTNAVKCLEDALFAAIGEDDDDVTGLIVTKHDREGEGRVELTLEGEV